MSRREGSPFAGLSTVALKEAADHMNSARIHLVMLLVLLTAIGSVYAAIGQIKATVGEDQFLFLRLFTTAQQPLPSFVSFLGFLVPLVAIALEAAQLCRDGDSLIVNGGTSCFIFAQLLARRRRRP